MPNTPHFFVSLPLEAIIMSMEKQNRSLANFLPLVCIALFTAVLMLCSRYCIAFKEQVSIFFFGPGCMDRYLSHPAILSSALGDLLTRFFMVEWLAVAISMLFIVLLWFGIRRFMRIVNAPHGSIIVCIIPVAIECACITYPNYPLSATIGLVMGVWAATLMAAIVKKNILWKIGYFICVPCLFILAGGPAATVFAIILLPLLVNVNGGESESGIGKKTLLFVFLAVAAIFVLLWLCGRLYGMGPEQSFVYPVVGGYIIPKLLWVGGNPILIAVCVWLAVKFSGNKWTAVAISLLSVGIVWMLKTDRKLEFEIEIGTHANYGEWDKVRELGKNNESDRIGLFFYNLTSAREGSLPENLLSVRQSFLADGLFLSIERGENYISSFYWTMALIEMGDFAQANDAALLGQTILPGGYSSRMMRYLAEIAIASAEYDVAFKYLDILSRTPGYMIWASDLKRNIHDGNIPEKYLNWRSRSCEDTDVMFHQGDIRSSLTNIADATPLNKVAVDYIMCAALLEKRVNSFIGMYEKWYLGMLDQFVDVPELYEQALLVNVNSNESLAECVNRYHLSETTVNRYLEFLQDQVTADGSLSELEKYRDTYWYYLMSTQLIQKDKQ